MSVVEVIEISRTDTNEISLQIKKSGNDGIKPIELMSIFEYVSAALAVKYGQDKANLMETLSEFYDACAEEGVGSNIDKATMLM